MRRLSVLFGSGILLLLLTLTAPSAHAQQIWAPNHGQIQLGLGYQYSHYSAIGRTFADSGLDTSLAYHLFDPLTGATSRITASVEAADLSGWGGHTSGVPPSLGANSVFFGGGPHVALESASRLQPWVHLLLGVDHLRFTQTATLGTKNGFGFLLGGGLDVRLVGPLYWRVQADYLGTNIVAGIQSQYSFGTGVSVYF